MEPLVEHRLEHGVPPRESRLRGGERVVCGRRLWEPCEQRRLAEVDVDGREATAANELTETAWDPVSKQPLFKLAAVAVSLADRSPDPSRAPTIGGSVPARGGDLVPATASQSAGASSIIEKG